MNHQGTANQIIKVFSDIHLIELVPFSIWFSYGSNLCRSDFEEKMKKRGSNLSLLNPKTFRLWGWKRILSNESSTRGLAYTIVRGIESEFVDGIVHEIPERDLGPFLSFEGVLDNNSSLVITKRRYDIVKIWNSKENSVFFTLVGRQVVLNEQQRNYLIRMHKPKIVDYVKTALNGALDFEIDPAPFFNDLKEIDGST